MVYIKMSINEFQKNEEWVVVRPAKHTSIMAAVSTFQSAVIRIRDILRGPPLSITGMDSMRHICLYLMSRYMTKGRVSSLSVPDEFAWETIIEMVRTQEGGMQFALDRFYNTVEDCLVTHFDRLFGTEKFSFDVKSPHKHREILEILDKVDMAKVDCEMDILGWVYEQHLKTGSGAARDLGQFFTDRSICDYMTAICKPGFKSPGIPESMCDPTMGTGGFLTSYIKYYGREHPANPVDWTVQEKEIHGCDVDPRVTGVSRMNLFMETGGHRPSNLVQHDSLYGDLPLTGYDVILANMPFGVRGLRHAECCKRVKSLGIRGTKSEPLFLQLMMVALNEGGRCAVVVPDGVLVNTSVLHTGTRRHLLDNFQLDRVIKMKGGFFMNTGIQPSILFFRKTGIPTEKVEFWEVEKNDVGVIVETQQCTATRTDMDDTCSLDMRRYKVDNVVGMLSSTYPTITLGNLIQFIGGKRRTVGEATQHGKFPFVTCSVKGTSCIDVADFQKEAIIINAINGSGKCRAYYADKYSTTSNNIHFTLKNNLSMDVSLRYLHRYLELNPLLLENGFTGGNQKKIRQDYIKDIFVPLPPRDIQDEIVEALDNIYQSKQEAEKLERNLRSRMESMVKSVWRRGFDRVNLDTVATLETGTYITKSGGCKEGFPIYGGGGACSYCSSTNNRENRLIIGKDGVSPKCVRWIKEPFHMNHHAWTLACKETVCERYLYYYMSVHQADIYAMAKGTAQKGINKRDMNNFGIIVPPMEYQTELIRLLDRLNDQVTSLQSLQKQSEEDAKFTLRGFAPLKM